MDVNQIRVSCYFDYHCFTYGQFGLRKVELVLQVSWGKRSKRKTKGKLGSTFNEPGTSLSYL